MFSHPAGNTLPNLETDTVQQVQMRIFGCPKHEPIPFQGVNKTRIAMDYIHDEVKDMAKNGMEWISSRYTPANIVKEFKISRLICVLAYEFHRVPFMITDVNVALPFNFIVDSPCATTLWT